MPLGQLVGALKRFSAGSGRCAQRRRFSLVFIYFINLIILSGTLIIVSNEISLTGFIQSLLSNGNELINRISKIIG